MFVLFFGNNSYNTNNYNYGIITIIPDVTIIIVYTNW